MKEEFSGTIGTLTSYLGYLKMKVKNGELSSEEFLIKEKEILNKIDKIVEETECNGVELLSEDKMSSITIIEDTLEINLEDNSKNDES